MIKNNCLGSILLFSAECFDITPGRFSKIPLGSQHEGSGKYRKNVRRGHFLWFTGGQAGTFTKTGEVISLGGKRIPFYSSILPPIHPSVLSSIHPTSILSSFHPSNHPSIHHLLPSTHMDRDTSEMQFSRN